MWTRSLSAPQVQAGQRRPIATGRRVPAPAPADALSVRWALGAFVSQGRDRTRTGLGSEKPMTSCELLSPPTWDSLLLLLSSPKGGRNGCLPVDKNESTSSTVLGALGSSEGLQGAGMAQRARVMYSPPQTLPTHTHTSTHPPTYLHSHIYTYLQHTHTHTQSSGLWGTKSAWLLHHVEVV